MPPIKFHSVNARHKVNPSGKTPMRQIPKNSGRTKSIPAALSFRFSGLQNGFLLFGQIDWRFPF